MGSSQNSSGSDSSQLRLFGHTIKGGEAPWTYLWEAILWIPSLAKYLGFLKWAEETDDFHQLQMALMKKNIEIVTLKAENNSLREQLARRQDLVDELH
ncbi:Radial spoke head 10-like protein B [Bienertia sinuspersici]